MNLKRIMISCSVLFFIVIASINCSTTTYAKAIKKEAPQNVTVQRHKNKSKELKLKWSKVEGVDGYTVYRYSNDKKKYIKVTTIYGNHKTSWIDRELKIHKIYKYKVASFELKKGKKVFSKRSYWVSARTYGNKGKLVNAEDIDIFDDTPININICSETKLQPRIDADDTTKNKKARPFSKEVRWISGDNSIVRISKNGKLTSLDKAGTCYLYVRAHNGITGKIKVNVINYARQASFPYYEGNYPYITDLLTDYRTEISNIAEYFTKYAKKGMRGVIKRNADGSIGGIPKLKNISTISADINKLMTQFPVDMEKYDSGFPVDMRIYYSDQGVSFKIDLDEYGTDYCEVIYCKWDDCEKSIDKAAPHWIADWHVHTCGTDRGVIIGLGAGA